MDQKMTPQTGSPGVPPDQKASSSGSSARDASKALVEGLTSGARDLSAEAKQVAGDLVGEARKVADSRLDAGKDFAAERLGSVAQALRHTSAQLRSEESGITEYVEKAASSVDSVSRYLQTRTLGQLIGDVESYARREPAIFLGGAFFVGLLGGRFLKAATPARSPRIGGEQRQGSASPWGAVQASGERGTPRLPQGGPQRSETPDRPEQNASPRKPDAPSATPSSNVDTPQSTRNSSNGSKGNGGSPGERTMPNGQSPGGR